MPSNNPPSWTSSFVKKLRRHELLNDGLDGDLPASAITAESLLPDQLAAKAAELAAREARLEAAEAQLHRNGLIRGLQLAAQPLIIGGRNGLTPSPDFDCVLTNEGPHPSVMHLPRQILWIPVPLFALPVPGKPHPTYGPSLRVGETRVQDSLCFPLMVSARPNPHHPSQPALQPVAINAYATVTLSQYTPDETLSRLDRRDRRHTLEINGPTADNDLFRDNLDAECQAPAFSSSPLTSAALRSFNVTSPHPSPSTVAAHNPVQSPSAPFDPDGNATRP